MPEGFFLGVLVALGLLVGGVVVGILAGWRLKSAQTHSNSRELQPVLSSLVQFTNSFSQDVSEYRSLIEAAAARAKALSLTPQTPSQTGADADSSALLLAQIMHANEHLRRRLDEAESSLQCKSEALQSYMTEARTDSMTELPNRRAVDDELGRRMAAYRRQGTPLGVLLIDVDRFKLVNDTFGHHIGDQVLKAVADCLRQAVRDCDYLARYGGEEFAVLVAGGTREEFMNAGERVRQFVERQPIRCDGLALQTTISCGVAEATGGEDIASLLRRADEALYASKTGGRNCAYWHDGRRSIRITASRHNDSAAIEPESAGSSEKFRDVCAELRRKLLELS
jgi:diguanylate cyclase